MPRALNSTFVFNFFKQPTVCLYNSEGILESSYYTMLVLANGMYCDNVDSLLIVDHGSYIFMCKRYWAQEPTIPLLGEGE